MMSETEKYPVEGYVKAVKDALIAHGLYLSMERDYDIPLFEFTILMDVLNAPCLSVHLYVKNDGYVEFDCDIVRHVSIMQRDGILELLNRLNARSRYVKFHLGARNDVTATYSFMVAGDEEEAAESIMSMLYELAGEMGPIDRSIPYIMNRLWGTINENDL